MGDVRKRDGQTDGQTDGRTDGHTDVAVVCWAVNHYIESFEDMKTSSGSFEPP